MSGLPRPSLSFFLRSVSARESTGDGGGGTSSTLFWLSDFSESLADDVPPFPLRGATSLVSKGSEGVTDSGLPADELDPLCAFVALAGVINGTRHEGGQ